MTERDGAGELQAGETWDHATVVSRRPIVDQLETDGGMVVLVEFEASHRIVRLSYLGAEILDAVGDSTTLGGLEAALLERLGPPPDTSLGAAVLNAVRELVAEGLLRAQADSST